MNEALVVLRDLVKTYPSGAEQLMILRGLSLDVPSGASVAISGESGSGKSTLLNILGGLDRASSGTVSVGEKHLEDLSEKALTAYRSRYVGFVFQFHYLLKDFSALENVMLPAYVAGTPKKEALKRARELLADVRMEHRLDHFPSQLSGGERQRVAVARALVNDPELVLADEPTGNLDPTNSALVAELLYACAERRGKTLLVVTHDERVAARASLRFHLEAGVFSTRSQAAEGEAP
jgi:lipoprotein-releasing system ATP-binding protein